MKAIVINSDFDFLERYIVENTESKIIFSIPNNVDINFLSNREALLDMFSDVELEFTYHLQENNRTVTCFKK